MTTPIAEIKNILETTSNREDLLLSLSPLERTIVENLIETGFETGESEKV